VSACYIDGAEIPINWKDEKRIHVLDDSISKNVYISNEEYRMHTGSKEQQEYEKNRRYGAYKKALKEFNGTTCKSAILSVSESYYKARLNTWSAMRKEMFHKSRICYRFTSFRKTHSALSYFSKKIIQDAKTKALNENKKLIVFFGNGSFSPGGTGYASVPRKPFIKELGIMCPTFRPTELTVDFLVLTALDNLSSAVSTKKSTVSSVGCK